MLKATTLALVRLVIGCTELTAHPRPRVMPLATGKATDTDAYSRMGCDNEWLCRCKRYQTNARAAITLVTKKELGVRYVKQNEHTHGSDGDQ